MGMTRSFYYIVNKGFSKEQMTERLSAVSAEGISPMAQEMEGLSRKLGEMCQRLGKDDGLVQLLNMAGAMGENVEPVVAYREDVRLFPCFDIGICEGYTASSRDDAKLSQRFGVPVLSFAVMDSDVLFASYSDEEKGLEFDCARANIPGMEDELYDTDVYRSDFPSFLLEYCDEADWDKLRGIWESKDYVFAEEKLEDIGELIGVELMYDYDDIPEGYEALETD